MRDALIGEARTGRSGRGRPMHEWFLGGAAAMILAFESRAFAQCPQSHYLGKNRRGPRVTGDADPCSPPIVWRGDDFWFQPSLAV
jgi:hypothetical protein